MKLALLLCALLAALEVRPRPEGWKPEAKGQKLKLELTLKERVISPKDNLHYRIAVINIGDAPVRLLRGYSFLSNPKYSGFEFEFYLTTGGRRRRVRSYIKHRTDDLGTRQAPFVPPKEEPGLDVVLQPGESLITDERHLKVPVDLSGKQSLVLRWSDAVTERTIESNAATFEMTP